MTSKYQAGTRISEYLLEALLGCGTFGEVWAARHHVWDNERVAIKLPTEPEYVRYLQREGMVVHGLRHNNIVRVRGLDPYAEVPYLVMELVEGPSLRALLGEHPKGVPIDVAQVILRGILQGVGAAHESNIVHRDLKPGNVLLHLCGKPLADLTVDDVKVVDFGLGLDSPDALRSMVEQSASLERDQQSAAIAGTLAYMAPEVRDTDQPVTPRADLYAVGVILYEMLTGERPAGAELPSTLRAEVPRELDDVFRRLYTRYDRRYASAAEVLADLSDAARGRGGAVAVDLESRPQVPPLPARDAAHSYAHCPRCQRTVEPDDQFCTYCGVQLVQVVPRCRSCGGYPGPRDRYCIFCGTPTSATEE